jgi:curli biogenesis system outer membrane secretion channel CsgG
MFLMVFSMYSCVTPGQESFNQGQGLDRQNRLEEAISLYEDAVAKEPDNKEYRATLDKARDMMASVRMDKAKSLLEVKPVTIDRLKSAQYEADKAQKYRPDSDEVRRLLSGIKSDMDRLSKRAGELYISSGKAAETNDWLAAVKGLREIKTFYPDYLDLPIKLGITESSAINYYLKEAGKLKADDDWGKALSMLETAANIQPDNSEITSMIKEAKQKNSAAYYLSKAEEAAKSADWSTVMKFTDKARNAGASGEANKKIDGLRQQASGYFIAKAEDALAARHLYTAYNHVMSAINLRPETRREQKGEDFILQLANAMVAAGDKYEGSGSLGNAYVWYDKASKLMPGRREFLSKVQSAKDKIKVRVVKKIAIMDFSPPSTNPDAGKIMTDSLLAHLTKNAGSEVKILARDVLGSILKEIELGQAGLSDIESAKKAGKLKGVDVFIGGSVLLYNIENNKTESQKMVNAVMGNKSVPNPEYQDWLAKHPRPTDEEQKSAPSRTINEEIRETLKYKVGMQKKTSSVSVSFRVIDVEEGEVKITKKLDKRKEAEGTYQEGMEFAGIPYKALEIVSDTELMGQVVDSAVAELGYEVLSRFQNLQVDYFKDAELASKKGDYEKAIEKYVDAMHVEELKVISSPVSQNSRKEVEQMLKQLGL